MPISIIELDGIILVEVNNEVFKLEDAMGIVIDIATDNCLPKPESSIKESKLYPKPKRSGPWNRGNSKFEEYE